MSSQVTVPLVAALLGAVGGWLSTYVLTLRGDRLLGRAAIRQLELELKRAEETLRTALPNPELLSQDRERHLQLALSTEAPIRDWGELHDWRITAWDELETRNRLAMRLERAEAWSAISRTVLRLDNLARWAAIARKGDTEWPAGKVVADAVTQVAAARRLLLPRMRPPSWKRRALLAAAAFAVLATLTISVVAVTSRGVLDEDGVAGALASRVHGESIVNCDAQERTPARWECVAQYDGCSPRAPSPTKCDASTLEAEDRWLVVTDSDQKCVSARLMAVWQAETARSEPPAKTTTMLWAHDGQRCMRN
jgi:hypothetical protein